jgi:succinate dehydrogenase/fumarate reductase flavoprotein subunit
VAKDKIPKDKKEKGKKNLFSRRDFLVGSGTIVAAGAGTFYAPKKAPATTTETIPSTRLNLINELPAPGQRRMANTEFNADVLVIGAGYAGTMAAVKAASMGQKVIVVLKGTLGFSGFSPYANTLLFYDEALGDKREDWIQAYQSRCQYLVDLDYLDIFINDSLARYKEWVEWGIVNYTNEINVSTDRRLVWPKIFKDRNIQVIERVMLTDLLTNNGAVQGAMGFHMESDQTLTFLAKAVVMCAGQGTYKNCGYPVNQCTFDGDAMGYKAGAKIGGKSWEDFHHAGGIYPADSWSIWRDHYTNRIYATVPPKYSPSVGAPGVPPFNRNVPTIHAEGDRVPRSPSPDYVYVPVDETKWENVRYTQDEYRPKPRHAHLDPWTVQGGATGLGVHASEGIFPVDNNCWSGIPGLYAAGDALCSRLCCTMYAGKGTSSSSAGVFGYRAGESAAKYAAGTSAPVVSKDQISRIQNDIIAPLKLKKGYDPRWVQEVLLSTMAPYYILKMKHKTRLEGALANVLFMRNHLAPKAMAADPHELRLCHEVRNMVLNAEMKLRSSLAREESRGTHWREDFPYRDDKNWLAWQRCYMDSNGNMVVEKVPVPDRMKTNKHMPYAERYNISFPGEREAITKLGIK